MQDRSLEDVGRVTLCMYIGY